MAKIYVLIIAEFNRIGDVFDALVQIPAVSEAHELQDEDDFDIVAEITLDGLSMLPPILKQRIEDIPGVNEIHVLTERTPGS